MNWQVGKFGKYQKCYLLKTSLLEISLLKCEISQSIPAHVDEGHEKSQYKIHINLIKPTIGGKFYCEKYILNTKRLKIYRADKNAHGIGLVVLGKRIDLIIGINI